MSRKMQAAVIEAPGKVVLGETDVPDPRPEEVVVKMEGCGVCASNMPVWEGRTWFQYPIAPGAPGHEGWGKIEAVGSAVRDLAAGDRVAFLSYHAFAEYDVALSSAVVKLTPDLDGVPFPGESVGCAVNVFRRSGIAAGQTVAIVGTGFLGIIITALATRCGARVIALSRRDFALEQAREFGAAETIVMDDHWKVIERMKELTAGRGCDVVVEATGTQWPLDLAGELTCERGRLVIAGYHQDGPRQVNMQLWNWRGLDVINAHERDPRIYVQGMQAAVDLLSAGLDISPLYTHRYSLEGLQQAYETMRSRPDGFVKALMTI